MGRKPCRLQASCMPVIILLEDHTALLKNSGARGGVVVKALHYK
jgi:hypothetical protein